MSDPVVGSPYQVSIGNDRMVDGKKVAAPKVSITATKENLELIKDRRIDDTELAALMQGDGDGGTLSVADLSTAKGDKPAPFTVSGAFQFLKAVHKDQPSLPVKQADLDQLAVIESKPTIATQVALAGDFPTFIKNLDKVGQAGVLMEVAADMAVLQLSAEAMTDPAFQTAYKELGLNTDPDKKSGNYDPKAVVAILNKGEAPTVNEYGTVVSSGKKLKDDHRQHLIKAVLNHPDVPLAAKHQVLEALGVTDPNKRNEMIAAKGVETGKVLDGYAAKHYKALGGPEGVKPETTHMATGNGSTTNGIGKKANRGIAYFDYKLSGSVTSSSKGDKFNTGKLGENQMTINPGKNDEIAVHLGAIGANNGGNKVTMTRGNQSYSFTVSMNGGGNTTITPDFAPIGANGQPQAFDDGFIRFDPKSTTVTFLTYNQDPITIKQKSADADEIAVSVTTFVTPIEKPEPIKLEFGRLFNPDSARFNGELDETTKADIGKVARYQQRTDTPITVVAVAKGSQDVSVDPKTKQTVLTPSTTQLGSYTDVGGKNKVSKEDGRNLLQDARYVNAWVDFGNDGSMTLHVESSADPVQSAYDASNMNEPGRTLAKDIVKKGKAKDPSFCANDVLTGARAWSAVVKLNDELIAKGGTGLDLSQVKIQMRGGVEMSYDQYQTLLASQVRQ